MQETYLYIFISVIIVSIISLIGVFGLSFREASLRKYLLLLVSLAIGALLGDAFIHLIPESFEALDPTLVGMLIIGGVLVFFILEKILHWHHHHGEENECPPIKERRENTIYPVGKMILISDGVHNFIDGIIIGASYFVSIEVGVATTIAVILHEIPQEIGDFGVLLYSGYTKTRALFLNFISALLAVLGAVFVVIVGEFSESIITWVIPIAAGGFIYIALSDLVPELHKTRKVGHSFTELATILIGIIAMILLVFTE